MGSGPCPGDSLAAKPGPRAKGDGENHLRHPGESLKVSGIEELSSRFAEIGGGGVWRGGVCQSRGLGVCLAALEPRPCSREKVLQQCRRASFAPCPFLVAGGVGLMARPLPMLGSHPQR